MRTLSPLSTGWSWPRRGWLAERNREDLFDDLDRIVDSFLQPISTPTVHFQPSCDIHEAKDHYLVSFDMPGVKKEDVKIEVQGHQLVVSGERQRVINEENHDESTLRHERAYGRFERAFTLPNSVAVDKIEAHYENGVLNIALPKIEASKGRSIPIQSGQGGFLSQLLGTKKEANKNLKDVKIS